MRLKERYDVICAGSGLSSYLCAALLAKGGKRVLVVDDEDPERYRRSNPNAEFDPDYCLFSGLGEGGALGLSLGELGISVEKEFVAVSSATQVLTGEYRIVLWRDFEATRDEIARELPAEAAELHDFFKLLYGAPRSIPAFIEAAASTGQGTTPESARWKRYWGKYYRPIAQARATPLASTFPGVAGEVCQGIAAGILGTMSYAVPQSLGFEQSVRGMALPLQGAYHYRGGLPSLKERLSTLIVDSGGSIKRNARVEALIVRGKRISGVLLSSFEGIINAGVVVLSSRLRRLYATLPVDFRDAGLLRGLDRVLPTHWRFTLSIKIDSAVVPIGVTETMTYIGSYKYPLEEENYLRLQLVPDGGTSAGSGGETTLLVTAMVPYRASTMDYSYLRCLSGKMVRVVSEIMPFLERGILAIRPDFRKGEDELREHYPFSGPEWVPESLMQYFVRGHRNAQDFWGPGWTTSHPNLYFAGRSIWPSLGIYGEALAARKIFDDVMRPGQ
jgi:hypothetical protein